MKKYLFLFAVFATNPTFAAPIDIWNKYCEGKTSECLVYYEGAVDGCKYDTSCLKVACKRNNGNTECTRSSSCMVLTGTNETRLSDAGVAICCDVATRGNEERKRTICGKRSYKGRGELGTWLGHSQVRDVCDACKEYAKQQEDEACEGVGRNELTSTQNGYIICDGRGKKLRDATPEDICNHFLNVFKREKSGTYMGTIEKYCTAEQFKAVKLEYCDISIEKIATGDASKDNAISACEQLDEPVKTEKLNKIAITDCDYKIGKFKTESSWKDSALNSCGSLAEPLKTAKLTAIAEIDCDRSLGLFRNSNAYKNQAKAACEALPDDHPKKMAALREIAGAACDGAINTLKDKNPLTSFEGDLNRGSAAISACGEHPDKESKIREIYNTLCERRIVFYSQPANINNNNDFANAINACTKNDDTNPDNTMTEEQKGAALKRIARLYCDGARGVHFTDKTNATLKDHALERCKREGNEIKNDINKNYCDGWIEKYVGAQGNGVEAAKVIDACSALPQNMRVCPNKLTVMKGNVIDDFSLKSAATAGNKRDWPYFDIRCKVCGKNPTTKTGAINTEKICE